ncbi:MAG: PEP-CTERM sorting domain-containing protein [Verrucomicrobia bacterium]|nr:PEP-CTERM sorting domain-containing protein [Verrucomicrobiota bacterium]
MAADVFTWSGRAGDHQYNNPANWVDAVVPPNNGTATLVFGNAQDMAVTLPFAINVAQIQFQNTASAPYTFNTQFLTFITLSGGITSTTGGTQRIGDDITLNLTGSQNFNITSGTLELAGGIMGSGNIVKTGAGNLRLDTFSLFTGNTQVDNGSLIYANPLALPFSGTISASSTSYVGAENSNTLKSMLGYLDAATFRGAIGLGTAPGATTTTTYSDQIDVSNLTQYAGLGSTTSARLTGNIKVGANQDYRFSGGAGTLYVGTNLTNQGSGLLVNSLFGQPLTVVLQGSNSFGGNASVLNSVLVLDSQQAVTGGKILNIAGPGYAGATERFASSSTSSFLSLINATSPNAIAGFDSTNLAAPRTITEAIDLSVGGTRNDPYYLGTSSKVTLTGKLTPTVGDSLYLTAVKGGHLVVGSTLGNNIPGLVVGQANAFDPQGGIVEINGRNNYTGGTKILGGTLRVSNDAALGTGSVDVGTKSTLDLSTGTTLTNSFSLASGARLSGNGAVGTPGGAYFGSGAILSPGGANAIGRLTFNTGVTFGSGSVFEFNIGNLNGGPGTGWDLVNVNGLLNLAAFSNSPITLDLNSLSLTGAPGLLSGFDANQSYSWLFLSAGNIAGFSSDKFSFNTTDFANSLGNGNFFVTQSNTGLSLNFAPVPEPGTYLLFAVGLGVVAILELRRRKK